jgi:uncharacterized protein (TIGR03086 family)
MSKATDSGRAEAARVESTELLDRAASATAQMIEGIDAERWHDATPCEEMDVLALVEHMVTGLDQFAGVGFGRPLVDPTDPQPGPSLTPESSLASYRSAADQMHDAWARPGAVEKSYDMPWGTTPGTALVDFMVIEEVTHGWDLARATGQHCALDDDLVTATLDRAHQYDGPMIRVPEMFGPEVSVPDTASLVDRLAGFLGRRP